MTLYVLTVIINALRLPSFITPPTKKIGTSRYVVVQSSCCGGRNGRRCHVISAITVKYIIPKYLNQTERIELLVVLVLERYDTIHTLRRDVMTIKDETNSPMIQDQPHDRGRIVNNLRNGCYLFLRGWISILVVETAHCKTPERLIFNFSFFKQQKVILKSHLPETSMEELILQDYILMLRHLIRNIREEFQSIN